MKNVRRPLVWEALIALCGFVFLGSGSASAQTAGDWILGRYKGGAHWYPGIIQSISADKIVVAYDDGDRESMSLSNVKPYAWAIGTPVECNFQGGGKWFPGVIASLAGESLGVKYDDGDKEKTKTGRCRSK
ncbi:tudor domain-containing protein [Methylobacterium sp. BTF04]|uniref:tudor domain-containing protein n=1 Tax=Methylobacterium sp. BTF04 TaxID=2708300 RepID=UPI001FF020EB|nr:tudor domain-containing protein [Methylobacterium sp. BTF04]